MIVYAAGCGPGSTSLRKEFWMPATARVLYVVAIAIVIVLDGPPAEVLSLIVQLLLSKH
ncbi:hypothetical protein [Streptomyces sp. SCA2-2]|uniref:hypothetical protein n=1 Tax=Streptomyces sp. SCA2-2 TaxID=1563677 RepID=UPI0013EF1A41|nr:hypothetical protein [Streptomyces sp. SCA2-2]